tara:strand:+ start:122 stop:838 length:717 start_codon:yes stop_codon:yes gene_type:complete
MRFLNFEIKKINKQKIVEEISNEYHGLIKLCQNYSMTTYERMWSLIQSCNYVFEKNISGDFVECGVWKGGNIILMKEMMKKNQNFKKIFCYDTFEGMPRPSKEDAKYNGKDALNIFNEHKEKNKGFCSSPLEEVKENIIRSSGNIDDILFIEGMVEKTLLDESNLPEKISILRLDTDFYESTKIEMEILFPRLVNNGILIIDDYGFWKGAKQAIDEYFKDKKPFLIRIDHSCRLLIKN